MDVHERFGAVTFLVRDRVGLAAALERLGGSANVVRARQLRSEAVTAAHQLGVGHLVRDVTDAEPSGATG